jgi:hypothetical protein
MRLEDPLTSTSCQSWQDGPPRESGGHWRTDGEGYYHASTTTKSPRVPSRQRAPESVAVPSRAVETPHAAVQRVASCARGVRAGFLSGKVIDARCRRGPACRKKL